MTEVVDATNFYVEITHNLKSVVTFYSDSFISFDSLTFITTNNFSIVARLVSVLARRVASTNNRIISQNTQGTHTDYWSIATFCRSTLPSNIHN